MHYEAGAEIGIFHEKGGICFFAQHFSNLAKHSTTKKNQSFGRKNM